MVFGVLAGVVQVLGLIRWVFLVPSLARVYLDPSASQGTRDAAAVVFQGFHRYAGVAIGEHLGYLFTGLWTLLVASVMVGSAQFPRWMGWSGAVLEATGVALAGTINAISYSVWALWLIALGVRFLRG